jgi:hypothetical protein
MRFELSGSFVRPDPLVLTYLSNDTFNTLGYINTGFTHFEVICIGGGGGMGGGIDTNNTGTLIRNFGGAGGGGGLHRVRGLLSALPNSCSVVVGAAGDPGTEDVSNPAFTTDGEDGGASTFNAFTCRASGGKGGKRAQSNSETVSTQADGGEGGTGNQTTAGGGAAGGLAATLDPPNPGIPGTPGSDGALIVGYYGIIGKGGGGGAGGIGKYYGTVISIATAGGRGSYNPGDLSVFGRGYTPSDDIHSLSVDIIPGGAGGAKATPLNELPYTYGSSQFSYLVTSVPYVAKSGVVIIRLTAE